jgi:hypothetical protein
MEIFNILKGVEHYEATAWPSAKVETSGQYTTDRDNMALKAIKVSEN